jgi:hypothetical protein
LDLDISFYTSPELGLHYPTTSFAIASTASDITDAKEKCYHYRASWIASCYCMNSLLDTISSGMGPAAIMESIKSQPKGCTTFFINYSVGTILQYVTIIITVLVNKYLLSMIRYLVASEYHTSVDRAQGSLVYKIFLSLYFNMAVLVLLASGRSGPQPISVQKMHIMQGLYSDLDAKWFGNIGTYFILTFITQVSTPILTSLAEFYIMGPLLRAWYYPGVKKLNTSLSRQHDLNTLQVGPIFDATTNQAQVLANVFFAMTYAAGLPISMPLAMVACIFYFYMDKLLLLRYFQRPPKLGNSVMVKVLGALYYAALIRLALACWMFGLLPVPWKGLEGSSGADDDLTSLSQSTILSQTTQSYTGILNTLRSNVVAHSASTSTSDLVTFFTDRIFLPNVFPVFLLFVILILMSVLSALFKLIYRTVPIFWVLECLLKSCSRKNRKIYDSSALKQQKNGKGQGKPYVVDGYDVFMMKHDLRKQSAPMTRAYFKYIPRSDHGGWCSRLCCCRNNKVEPDPRSALDSAARDEGWDVADEREVAIQSGYDLHAHSGRQSPEKSSTGNEIQPEIVDKHRYVTVKHWNKQPPAIVAGVDRYEGELKRTFEIVHEHACSSYALDEIPAYQTAMVGILESLQALKDIDDYY